MHRRLNPQIFEEGAGSLPAEEPSFSAVTQKRLENEVFGLKKTVSQPESQVEVLRGQVSQLANNSEQKVDTLSRALAEIEKESRDQDLHLSQELRQLEERVTERRVIDGKIENMVDRYNTSLQQFENRLTSLQKVISEKEMTLMKYNSAIEQIFKELEKLKKSKL